MINFNVSKPCGKEQEYVLDAISRGKISGDGYYSRKCESWFTERFDRSKVLMTPSCTHALEMAAILIDVQPGDEIIMPSYTFVSTANAFVLRGANLVFVDINPKTMNIDENLIEQAITEKTKAIVPVHYAGFACEMNAIMSLADKYGLFVIEDAAQGVMSSFQGQALGTIGHIGTFSFHDTKNYTSGGEGGLLILNDSQFNERSEIIREKGTNRSVFLRGEVDKYSWKDIGSSYLPSELQSAYLYGQLECADIINNFRLSVWEKYYSSLCYLSRKGFIELPDHDSNNIHNAHMFFIKLRSGNDRTAFISFMKEKDIQVVSHYVPLHLSEMGVAHGRFEGVDRFTSIESNRIVRLPLWFGIDEESVASVIDGVKDFFGHL